MSLVLLLAMLSADPGPADGFATMKDAASSIEPAMQTGTLLVSKGDCLAVRIYTQSPLTHVAAVVIRNGKPFVYDSANGVGVRCQTLENYLKSLSANEIYVLQPTKPFSAKRAGGFASYLDSQLGKPYAIKHHLTGERAAGVHCAEYVTDALQDCRLVRAKQPARVSPASLVEGVVKSKVYHAATTIQLTRPEPPPPPNASWCSRLWFDTTTCTSSACLQMKRWFLCQ